MFTVSNSISSLNGFLLHSRHGRMGGYNEMFTYMNTHYHALASHGRYFRSVSQFLHIVRYNT